jgi:hypothetical protein
MLAGRGPGTTVSATVSAGLWRLEDVAAVGKSGGGIMGGQDEEQLDVEWLGYERSAPSAELGGMRWGQMLVSATVGALAALAAVALLSGGSSAAPAARRTTTTTIQPRPPLVGATHQPPPLDGLSDDVACVPLGASNTC